MNAEFFKVGDSLKCLQYVRRYDRMSEINAGDIVKVTQEFKFEHNGKQYQDVVVQRGRDAPISVLVSPGRFERA